VTLSTFARLCSHRQHSSPELSTIPNRNSVPIKILTTLFLLRGNHPYTLFLYDLIVLAASCHRSHFTFVLRVWLISPSVCISDFVAQGPSPFVVNREKVKGRLLSSFCARASHHGGFSCCRAQAPEHRSSSCSTACEIFPDQVLNLHPLYQQVDSQPLGHQGSPRHCSLFGMYPKQTD